RRRPGSRGPSGRRAHRRASCERRVANGRSGRAMTSRPWRRRTGMRFRTTILTAGKTATGIEVPPEVVEALGASKRPPVRVMINGYTYRNTIAVMGGKYMVGVSAEHRAGA